MGRRQLAETEYRASRLCRVLGNPTAYQILKILIKRDRSVSALAEAIGLSIKTISYTLKTLRQVDLVRYDTRDKNKVYFIKDPLVQNIVHSLEEYTNKMREKKW
ncbi:MAG: metalloregulator ArsR/SmtB family transcription factor [candidate division WOR-3 bacterium]